jgi:hypothetical protein
MLATATRCGCAVRASRLSTRYYATPYVSSSTLLNNSVKENLNVLLKEAQRKAQEHNYKEAQTIFATIIEARESDDFLLLSSLQGFGDSLCG